MIHLHKYSSWTLLYTRRYENDWGDSIPQRVYESFCDRCGKPKVKAINA